jgi:KaiC/GvpD/RAD55 family RecA-like ATPase
MLVRGGPGAGKSVLATDLALRLARALGGDVLYACVELLPSEVLAQRMGFEDFNSTKAIDLAQPEARKASGDGPTLVVGMTEMAMSPLEEGGDVPDLGGMILDLARLSFERGCEPRVVVVDSLSDGYGLGARAPRPTVDAVCKLAIEQGWVLVLVEEAADDRASPWSFAVDTVLSLEVTPEGRREVRVTKHRFGACQPGPHRLLVEREIGVRVIPCFAAYRNAVRDLALPKPAKNRSLRVPVVGPEPDWTTFNVTDEQGRVVAASFDGGLSPDAVNDFTAAIGALAPDGSPHPGARVALYLHESHELPFEADATGFTVGTLHQMVDGEEWLEAALSRLILTDSPLARVRIGPTYGIDVYEQSDTLQKAISLLASILARRGLIVLVYGRQGEATVFRAGIVSEEWIVSSDENAPTGHVKVLRNVLGNVSEFKAVMK